MAELRLTAWLRPLLSLLAVAGALSLSACGGGSGAPNNQFVAPPGPAPAVVVQPGNINVFSGAPATLTITSGTGPFTVFSDTPAVLPVAQSVSGNVIVLLANQVAADTPVQLTVTDALGKSVKVQVIVKAAPLFNSLTFQPSGSDCGSNLCSAQVGTARVTASAPGGAPLVGRQIRFDVVYGPVAFNTGNPAQPTVQSITVSTDVAGVAEIPVQALPNSTTQPAQIRATDVTSGNLQIANFTVVNNTTATQSPIVVVPNSANITGPDNQTCSSGFRTDYYIYGGTPPYTIQSTFPQAVTLSTTAVANSGSFFSATTNGTCVNPLVFTISDSAGKQTTATLVNALGTVPPPGPVVPATLTISPTTATGACLNTDYPFAVAGGTGSYNVFTTPSQSSAPTQTGGIWHVGVTGATGDTIQVTAIDQGSPRQTATATITCK